MEKLHSYQGWTGRFHELRDEYRTKYVNWRDRNPGTFVEIAKRNFQTDGGGGELNHGFDDPSKELDYSHIYRKKSRLELIRVSAAVMGIEFSYAAETAFVSPTLLKIGVEHKHMTLVWALSPLVGFFLTPILGSLSDKCRLELGRRRPFIILLSIGVLCGLLLVPNGEDIGYALGDFNAFDYQYNTTNITSNVINILPHRTTTSDKNISYQPNIGSHPWGIFFTILGTVLLDFDADACQSPARAYLLDVTIPDDHAKGLSTFTIMAGLGGFMGYSLGGINWDDTSIGILLGGHVRAVFTLITVIFITCVSYTITSFKEIPLKYLESSNIQPHEIIEGENIPVQEFKDPLEAKSSKSSATAETTLIEARNEAGSYGTLNDLTAAEEPKISHQRRYTMPPLPTNTDIYSAKPEIEIPQTPNHNKIAQPVDDESSTSLRHYLMSIIFMPTSLRLVCLTNLFCWMAHVCYSLYFTDFVGEAVFGGDPKAEAGNLKHQLYEEGVRFGCWGMAMYSLSCACYSSIIERLIKKFGARRVYVGGLLVYCVGMTLMALTKHRVGVILFSWTAGVMYSTLFTMPYLLVAHYHDQGTFEVTKSGEAKLGTEVRGLGTDVAIISSMVFLAQFILSMCMGTIVSLTGTTTAVVSVASFLSFCGAISATQVMYLDL